MARSRPEPPYPLNLQHPDTRTYLEELADALLRLQAGTPIAQEYPVLNRRQLRRRRLREVPLSYLRKES